MLSYWPARNMLSSQQRMNMSFNPFHLVEYLRGLRQYRPHPLEMVIEGTDEPAITEQTNGRNTNSRVSPVRCAGCRDNGRPITCGWIG